MYNKYNIQVSQMFIDIQFFIDFRTQFKLSAPQTYLKNANN